MKSATLALLALVTSSSACIERAEPCDNGTFDGEINQGLSSVAARDFEGNSWGYALGDDAREQLAKCRSVTGHLYGHAIDDSYFPNLESLGSIGTFDPWDKSDHLPLLTGWDQLTELGGVLGTVDRIEGFGQIRSIGIIEGLDVIGFNNLEHVGNLDVSNVPGLTSLETAGAIRLSWSADVPSPLPRLTTISSDFVFAFPQFSQLNLIAISYVGGDFGVSGGSLSRFSGFASATSIEGGFYFYGNSRIEGESVRTTISNSTIGGPIVICQNAEADPCPTGFDFDLIQPSGRY